MDVNVWKPERAEGPLPVVYLNVFQGDGAPVWEACQEAGCPPFALAAVGGLEWNRDLSPWGVRGHDAQRRAVCGRCARASREAP